MLSAQTQASGNGLSRSSTTLARTSGVSWPRASSQIVLWSVSHQARATPGISITRAKAPLKIAARWVLLWDMGIRQLGLGRADGAAEVSSILPEDFARY